MRILNYIEYLDSALGGPVRATLDLTSLLAARGHQVAYITRDDRDAPADTRGSVRDLAPGKVTVIRLPPGRGMLGRFTLEQFKIVREAMQASDVAHVHGLWKPDNMQLSGLADTLKKPYFISLRGMLDDWSMDQKPLRKRVFLAMCGRRHLGRAHAVHCTAQAEFDQARKWFPEGRGVVIPNLLDLNPFRNPPGPQMARGAFKALQRGLPSILFLSRIHYKKGIEVLLRASALLKSRGFAHVLIVAGTGDASYVAQMHALVTQLGLEETVEFVGHVGGPMKVSLYEACDLFALPTSQENFGFVFPEALASGTPVITTKGVDIWPELLESGGSSIVEGTPESFAAEMAKLIDDSELRRRMAESGRPFVMRIFDEQRLIERYEALYAGQAEPTPAS
jgi:glycosyltransferase involved in cell wall biosynthesis